MEGKVSPVSDLDILEDILEYSVDTEVSNDERLPDVLKYTSKRDFLNALVEQDSKNIARNLRKRYRALEKEKLALRSFFIPQNMRVKIFEGIPNEIMFNKMKQPNTLSCPNKPLYFSTEILQEIIKRCDVEDRMVLSLVSKQMALNVEKINGVPRIKRKPLKRTNTELQQLGFLIRLDDWMEARRLCFGCLRYKPAYKNIWYTKKKWPKNKWEGGAIKKHKERAQGPRCRNCAARDRLQAETTKEEVIKLRALIMNA